VRRHVAVVGGGIAGLAAAHELASADVDVTVLEASARVGGKIRSEPFAGATLDTGPDAFLARRPEAVALCEELGVADELVAPATTAASVWSRGRVRPLPAGLVLGVPTDVGALARSGILSPWGTARAALEPLLPGSALPGDRDEAVGALVRRRLGGEAAARLVDPLLGGINAGDTDRLSLEATAPQLTGAARSGRSLVRRLRSSAPATGEGPLFLTPAGGLQRLVQALAARLRERGARLETGAEATALDPADGGYRLRAGGRSVTADGVVLAVPAGAAAGLLASCLPSVAATMAAVEHASVVLVALAYAPGDAGALRGSGFLVPRPERRLMTACTFTSSKWAHLARPERVLLRVSAGRAGDDRAMAMDDDDLVARVRVELRSALGITATPREVRVTRWPASFPQYAPGHVRRMDVAAQVLRSALPGVGLAGAALGGIGVPACIGSGRAAARAVLGALAGRTATGGGAVLP
jgi:oxygen-dependent protoporphyrinogen oxidase